METWERPLKWRTLHMASVGSVALFEFVEIYCGFVRDSVDHVSGPKLSLFLILA